jgi:hypothetical protein
VPARTRESSTEVVSIAYRRSIQNLHTQQMVLILLFPLLRPQPPCSSVRGSKTEGGR